MEAKTGAETAKTGAETARDAAQEALSGAQGIVASKLDKPAEAPTAAGKVLKVLSVNADGSFVCEWADDAIPSEIDGRLVKKAITPVNLDYAVKAAMCDGKGATWTADEQAAARERIGIPGDYKLLRDITIEEDISKINLGDVQSKDAIIILKSVSGCGSTPYYKSSSGLLFYAGTGSVIYSVARISRYYVETTARNSLNEYSSCSKLLADSVDANVGNLRLYSNITENSITAGTNIKIYVR